MKNINVSSSWKVCLTTCEQEKHSNATVWFCQEFWYVNVN